MPNPPHFDHLGHARFVTFSTYQRFPLLATEASKKIVLQALQNMRTLQNVKLFGYVIMPDHLHLVLLPSDGTQLTTLIRSFKIVTTKRIMTDPSFIASIETIRNIDTHGHFRVWQHRGFDHNCRGTESVLAKIEYCHRNPVRAGLVEQSTEYPWSSARWYAGIRDQMLVIDDMYQELR